MTESNRWTMNGLAFKASGGGGGGGTTSSILLMGVGK
jgi:hypothetical protein